MKLKELYRIMSLSLAVSLVTPMTAFASESTNAVVEIPEGCYYDEEGVLRNADGSVYEEPEPVVEEVAIDTGTPDVSIEDSANTSGDDAGGVVDNGVVDNSVVDNGTDNGIVDEGNDSGVVDGGNDSGVVDDGNDSGVVDGDSDEGTGDLENPDGSDNSDGTDTESPDGSDNSDGTDTENPDDSDNSDGTDTESPDDSDTPNNGVVEPEEPDAPNNGVVPEEPAVPEQPVEETQNKGVVDDGSSNVVTQPRQRIQMPVVTIKDFRFYTIEKEYAFAKEEVDILEDMNDEARVMGVLPKDGRCFVIKDVDENWTFVESEDVRGFVRNEKLALNEEADTIVEALKQKAQELTDKENEEIKADLAKKLRGEFSVKDSLSSSIGDGDLRDNFVNIVKMSTKGIVEDTLKKGIADEGSNKGVVEDTESNDKGVVTDESEEGVSDTSDTEETIAGSEDSFEKKLNEEFEKVKKPLIDFETLTETATESISWKENKNIAYARGTVKNFVAQKDYALVTASTLNVREGKGTDTRIVAELPNNALVYQLADKDQEWVYVESGDVRGFVYYEYLRRGDEVNAEVAEVGEENFPSVNEIIDYSEVTSLYYVRESVKEGKYSSKAREQIVNYASQFIGNPYVWGGTDPVNGADCSGFVQSIYSDFGYSLPRVAQDQAYYGTKIAVEDALPGDLIFYMNSSGYIYHVVMYAGDGRTVEAANSKLGIINGTVDGNACWATRIISENDDVALSGETVVRYADPDEYGRYLGNYRLTYYCACSICCGEYANGITATGTTATEGRTIAVDPRIIPYGSEVIINGRVYVAEDCGGAIKGNHIDIYMNSHEECLRQGVVSGEVYLKK